MKVKGLSTKLGLGKHQLQIDKTFSEFGNVRKWLSEGREKFEEKLKSAKEILHEKTSLLRIIRMRFQDKSSLLNEAIDRLAECKKRASEKIHARKEPEVSVELCRFFI